MNDIITEKTLADAGINTTRDDLPELLKHLNESLEERVGSEITESLDDEKLEEMLAVQEKGSDQELAEWLSTNVPEFNEVLQDEIDILLGELAESADAFNDHL